MKESIQDLTIHELQAWIITRQTGIMNINEAVATLEASGPLHTFAPFRPIDMLTDKRFVLCQEIHALKKELALRESAVRS